MSRVSWVYRMPRLTGCVLAAWVALSLPVLADSKLELSLVVGSRANYVTPDGRRILIGQQPTQFSVQVRNTATTSKQIWVDRISGALSKLRFEVTDEQGVTTTISKKEKFAQGSMWTSRYLEPDETVVTDILLTPEEWNNVTAVAPGDVRRLKVRALYQSDGRTLTSETYEVTIAPEAPPGIMMEPPPAPDEAVAPITVIE